mmetsp:Transcript_95277/g.254798  ORF Transcript_95277/g.254798 Transcript_95277/m.254798 type:complete len:160 (+) Transcript_95277:65-544(+)
MLTRIVVLVIFDFIGVGVAMYTWHIENMLTTFPGYQPACDISGFASCSKVFKTPYAHILSHWGIVPPGHTLDWSLPQLALVYFAVILLYPAVRRISPTAKQLYFGVGCLAVCFNLYLAAILKFVVQEFCILCVSNYVVNGVMFACLYKDLPKAKVSKAE